VALGLGALVIGTPRSGKIVLDERELAAIVEGELDHVTPDELADWIVAGRQDFRLIDLRTAAEYAEYHIPQAANLAITALADADLARNEKIVLYSAEGIHSAQAWFLLKAKQFPAVYILLGGLKQWTEQVVFPAAPGRARAGRAHRLRGAAERAVLAALAAAAPRRRAAGAHRWRRSQRAGAAQKSCPPAPGRRHGEEEEEG
jgi:rhodanese-related sulfurtransferase